MTSEELNNEIAELTAPNADAVPHLGWMWREVDFDGGWRWHFRDQQDPDTPEDIGACFDESGKWGYPSRLATDDERAATIALLYRVVGNDRRDSIAAIAELQAYMKALPKLEAAA